jgi:signal transduction histidine kinase
VGLDGAPLARVAGAAVRRTTLVGAVLAALGVLGLAAALAEHARAREREALTRRLGAAERSRQQAERLASAGTLAAGLAHEIRNPLNAVGLAAQRLLRGGALDEAQRSLVERIRLEVGRLEAVLRGFLDLARPAAGERRATDLADVAREVLGTLELEAEARGVALVAELGPAVAAVEPEAVRRAVLNLVRNALEASPRGAAVEVATGAAPTAAGGGGPRARLTVRDRGPGVPAELRERAFEAFVTTKVDGTGLGLALVARVASAHGGSAELAPRPGGGTEAVLEVPRAGVATAPVETAA